MGNSSAESRLSSSRRNEVVTTALKYVEVVASPGSGKTYSLIEQINYLLSSGVLAEQVLVLSFSNASVDDLHRRIAACKAKEDSRRALNQSSANITIQTAHAFALELGGKRTPMKQQEELELLAKAIKLTQRECVKRMLWAETAPDIRRKRRKQLASLDRSNVWSQILQLISVVRASRTKVADALQTGQFSHLKADAKVLAAIRNRYARLKRQQGKIDYGDMLDRATRALERGASLPFTHVLVDEYQDCSPAQVHLLARLAQRHECHLMVFGDPDQAIYGFAGASYTPLSSVLEGVKVRRLPVSRRLTSPNAALASAVAQHSPKRVIKTLRDGVPPVLVTHDSQTAQAAQVVDDIIQLLGRGVPAEQIVVLARLKQLLEPVEKGLLARQIHTRRMGLDRDVKYPLRILRLVRLVEQCESRNEVPHLDQLTPLRFLSNIDASLLKKAALSLKKVSRSPSLEGRYKRCTDIYLRLRGGIRKSTDLRDDVNRWTSLCRGYSDARSMRDALRSMKRSAVVSGTIHSAKGGEWAHVFIVGATDGLLPHYQAKDDASLGEERRLLYVAITRAKESVRLYHAPTNHSRSRQRFEKYCRFLGARAVQRTLKIKHMS